MRVAVAPRRAAARPRPAARATRSAARARLPTPWHDQRLAQDRADPHPRVQRRVRVLEHQLDRGAGARAAAPGCSRGQVGAVEARPTPPVGCSRPTTQPAERGLAAAGLADHAEGLAAARRRSDTPADRADRAAPARAAALPAVSGNVLDQVRRRSSSTSPGPPPVAAAPGGAAAPGRRRRGRGRHGAAPTGWKQANRCAAPHRSPRSGGSSSRHCVRGVRGSAARTGSPPAAPSGPAAGPGWCTAAARGPAAVSRQRGEQRLGVGVPRAARTARACRAGLGDLARVHHGDPVGPARRSRPGRG